MINAKSIVSLFQAMYKERWSYIWGMAQKGCVDCSGAFVYAYKALDGKSIIHGSNGIARKWISGSMLPISMARPGMAAFKVRKPGEPDYDLPERYRQNGAGYTGDLMDYYHIGLVDSDSLCVLNAKSASKGFCRDVLTAKNGWDYVAFLKDIEYEYPAEGGGEDMDAKVVLPTGAKGKSVNMRSADNKSASVITTVPVGAIVGVIEDKGQWCKISHSGRTGWMMSNYLEYLNQGDESGGGDTLSPEDRESIDAALSEMEKQIGFIRDKLGKG